MKAFVARIVDFSGRRPWLILFFAIATLVSMAGYARHLEFRKEFLDLLPKGSPGYKAYTRRFGRTGGGASLIVVVRSPDRAANEHFIDDLSNKLEAYKTSHPEYISYIETGTKDTRKFFQDNKWLYADLKDLEAADQKLDHRIAVSSGLVSDLEDDTPAPSAAPAASGSAAPPSSSKLGMDDFRERWDGEAKKHDDFPTGYFATPDGSMLAVRIVAATTGMGDRGSDILYDDVKKIAASVPVPNGGDMGYAGDIPNAREEADSIVSDAAWASALVMIVILGCIVYFFRSFWSLAVIALPVFLGISCAYAFAMRAYGYVNTSGLFLGAIILGNGINYPIVLLARYREFRARGQSPEEARRDAVWNAFRAELVGALVAAIAYGSLVITRFRGFNQFGMIGFVGMLLVWLSMIPCVPALLVLIERLQARLPKKLRDPDPKIEADGSRGPVTKWIARATEAKPWAFVSVAIVLALIAASALPSYLRDPWEYNFANLGSRSTKVSGAGEWSVRAEKVFGGKMNIAGAMILADNAAQVPALKKQILANDAADPQGQLLAQIATVDDVLPGTLAEQKQKLAVLDRIRERLTPKVLDSLSADERAHMNEMRPPETLKPIDAVDLPRFIRRRFEERDGTVGTVFYVKPKNDVSISDGHKAIRMAKTTDNVTLPDGTLVPTASQWSIYAEMLHSMETDGPLAMGASFAGVIIVILFATRNLRGAFAVLSVLVFGVLLALSGAAFANMKLNFLNFIALPITFGIGCEYPFNIYDRSRLLAGDITAAVKRTGGAVALCSITTTIGYGSLLLSDEQALQSFGRLAMSGEICCLLGAMLVLPAILHLMKRSSSAPVL